MKRINKRFTDYGTINAKDFNEIIDAINEIHFKINYLYYKETDPDKAADLMAEILGGKKES